jgi:hypothetical protein
MKIYKLLTKGKTAIPIETREEVDAIVAAVNKGARLVQTKYGIVDSSSIDSITVHKELMQEICEQMKYDKQLKSEDVARKILGAPIFEEEKKLLK